MRPNYFIFLGYLKMGGGDSEPPLSPSLIQNSCRPPPPPAHSFVYDSPWNSNLLESNWQTHLDSLGYYTDYILFQNKAFQLFVCWVIFGVVCWHFSKWTLSKNSFRSTIRMWNRFDPDQDGHSVGPDQGPNCLQRLSAEDKNRSAKFNWPLKCQSLLQQTPIVFLFWSKIKVCDIPCESPACKPYLFLDP